MMTNLSNWLSHVQIESVVRGNANIVTTKGADREGVAMFKGL